MRRDAVIEMIQELKSKLEELTENIDFTKLDKEEIEYLLQTLIFNHPYFEKLPQKDQKYLRLYINTKVFGVSMERIEEFYKN